ncbi:hypothetical protein PENNAL_c0572G09847 [Penicillium nalgiovense]|uniref:Uncharacterized protein n=1 Tax=Penicillium nalgiovense TaxID=60175 RepID=A0A1V6VBW7_PENNA|nr:hypothetical protein PENNAL_c0572G09847 [Penicillium nalgiovense]
MSARTTSLPSLRP